MSAERDDSSWTRLDARGSVLIILTQAGMSERGCSMDTPVILLIDLPDGSQTSIGTFSIDRVRELLPTLCPSCVGFVGAEHERAELEELSEAWNAAQRSLALAKLRAAEPLH